MYYLSESDELMGRKFMNGLVNLIGVGYYFFAGWMCFVFGSGSVVIKSWKHLSRCRTILSG